MHSEFDTADADLLAALGDDWLYTPVGSAEAVPITGIFSNADNPIGDEFTIEGNGPAIMVHSDDVSDPKKGDRFEEPLSGDVYECVSKIKDEGALQFIRLKVTS